MFDTNVLQLSATAGVPRLTPEAAALQAPASADTLTAAGAVMVGSMRSRTVTLAVAVWKLPHASVAVNVTTCTCATSSQSNDVTSSDKVTSLQASFEPLSMSAVVIVAAPLASKSTVMSWVMTVGLVSSSMVKVAVVLELLFEPSVTVKVTVTSPVAPHSSLKTLDSIDSSGLKIHLPPRNGEELFS